MDLPRFATTLVENASSCFLESFEGLSPEHVWAQIAPDANPIAWMVGHCACHLDALQSTTAGTPRLLRDVSPLFRTGTRISDVLPNLPPFAYTVDGFLQRREQALRTLSSANPDQLIGSPDDPSETPLEMAKRVSLHLSLHLGHILLIRKCLGVTSPRGFFPGLKPQHRREALARWNQWWSANRDRFNVNPHAHPAKEPNQ